MTGLAWIDTLRWPLEAAALLLTSFGFLYPLLQWNDLPDKVPYHFGITGRPDGWGRRWVLILFGLFEVVWYLIFCYAGHSLSYLTGGSGDAPAQDRLMLWVKTGGGAMFAYLTWSMVRVAQKRAEKANVAAMLAIAALLIVPLLAGKWTK